MVVVDVPSEDKKEEPKKKGRGRPPGTTKKKAASKKKSAQMDSSQIKMLLLTTTAIFAARPGMEDFALTADEADQISEPLASILSKSEGIAGVAGEYADHIALLIACFTIFVPKFLMWKAKQPKKKEVKHNVIPKRELPEQRTAERETRKPSPRDVKRSGESDVKEFGATLHQFVDLGGY
ncbi:hypothetical protein [Bacillus velezensis]|uniref:hypothetical protein n=1 Tax=Bacillus velezensis TaxID=492670 RepID=UPI003EB8FCA1